MKNSAIDQILIHLYNCIDTGFSYRAKKMFLIDDLFLNSNWKNFSKEDMQKGFKNLKKLKLIVQNEKNDGSINFLLSEKGKLRALNSKFKLLNYRKKSWDKKWRMVAFDIPNTQRKERRALQYRLKTAGFHELQKSMFIYPYDCEQEIRDFVKLFKIEKYVCFGLLDFIDGRDYLMELFELD